MASPDKALTVLQMLRRVKTELLKNRSTVSITNDLADKWGVTPKTVVALIKQAQRDFTDDAAMFSPAGRVNQRRLQFEVILEQCMAKGDLKNAISCLTQLAKIDSCYPADRIELISRLDSMDSSTKENRLKELLEERKAWLASRAQQQPAPN